MVVYVACGSIWALLPRVPRNWLFLQSLPRQGILVLCQLQGAFWTYCHVSYVKVNSGPEVDSRTGLQRMFLRITQNGQVCTVDASVAVFYAKVNAGPEVDARLALRRVIFKIAEWRSVHR